MRKLLTFSAALILGASALCAQEPSPYNPAGRWYVSVQGGPMYQSNENAFSYRYNNYGSKLITYDAAVSVGYNFDEIYGIRASVNYGLNRSACNTVQTSSHGFYPYDFKSIGGFVDFTIDINGLNAVDKAFSPKIYGGIGMGHSSASPSRRTMVTSAPSPGRRRRNSTPGSMSMRATTPSHSVSASSPNTISPAVSAFSPTSASRLTPTVSTAFCRLRKTTRPAPAMRVSPSTCASRSTWVSSSASNRQTKQIDIL